MNTTKIYRLSGFNKVPFYEKSKAQNYLDSEIDMRLSLLNYRVTADDLNKLDVVIVAQRIYQLGYNNSKGASILQAMYSDGLLANANKSDIWRDENLALLLDAIPGYAASVNKSVTGDLYYWYMNNIVANDIHLSSAKQNVFAEAMEKSGISGTNDTQDALIATVKESAFSFLYILADQTYINELASANREVLLKQKNEQKQYTDFCNGFAQSLSETTIRNYLVTGFYEASGLSPDEYIRKFAVNGILPPIYIAPKIGVIDWLALITIIISAIKSLYDFFVRSGSSAGSVTDKSTENLQRLVIPANGDLPTSGTVEAGFNPLLLLLPVGLGIAMLSGKKGKKNEGYTINFD
jgi:hypothetical protein